MQYVRLQDAIAALLTVGLLVLIGLLVILERDVPDTIQNGFVASLAWTFRGAQVSMNDFRHRERGDTNAGP